MRWWWMPALLAACEIRVPVLTEDDVDWRYELPQQPGECEDDGDCKQNGCGQYCTHADVRGFVTTCEWPTSLDGADCGCVRSTCAWYTIEPTGPQNYSP